MRHIRALRQTKNMSIEKPYEPSAKEIEKAENTMEELGLGERSQAEQDAFETGKHKGQEELLNMKKDDLDIEKLIKDNDLSKEAGDLLKSDDVGYSDDLGRSLWVWAETTITEKQFLEFAKKLNLSKVTIESSSTDFLTKEVLMELHQHNKYVHIVMGGKFTETGAVDFSQQYQEIADIYKISIAGGHPPLYTYSVIFDGK